jgi:hypothetical protein
MLVCNWPHSVGQNHLYVKMLFNKDSAIQECFKRFCIVCKSEILVPCQPSGRRTIPSGRSSVQCSIRSDDVSYRPDVLQTKHHSSRRRGILSGPFTVSRSFCSSLHPSGRLSSPSGRPSVFEQASDSFQNHIWEDSRNHPDDVDSCLDALLLKARIAIQLQQSERRSAWSGCAFNRYGNCVFNINCQDACLSWSGRALNSYGNCVLKINRPDGHPYGPDARSRNKEITYSGRATVRTTVPHHPDVALKQERFSAKI